MAWFDPQWFDENWFDGGFFDHDPPPVGTPFISGGSSADVSVTGNSGTLTNGFSALGVAASVAAVGLAGSLFLGEASYWSQRWYPNSWFDANWFDSSVATSTGFNGVGTSANLDVQGFSGGLPFTGQGSTASVGNDAYYSGFLPDTGGILDNDSDPDGDPLSYTVVTQPQAGTLTTYAGGAFDWVIPISTPEGRYSWTYQLYAGGEAGNIGTVRIEHGQVYASVGSTGFAGALNFDFQEQGSAGTVFVTGFSGDLTLTFDKQGAAAQSALVGLAGTIEYGSVLRGTAADTGSQGFSGALFGTFNQQGTSADSDAQGFAAVLPSFSVPGTSASVSVSGFAGDIVLGAPVPFDEQGSGVAVDIDGGSSNLLTGFSAQGTVAVVTAQGFAEVSVSQLGGQFYAVVPVDRDRFTVPADDAVFSVQDDDFIGVV